MEVTDHSTSKMAVLPISECFDRLVHMPVSHNTDLQGDTYVPLLQVKAHWEGIGLSATPQDIAHLSLGPQTRTPPTEKL